jgi:predicted Ser/Thr protein kinase
MLLGSGKAAIESTQTPIDTTVVLTTNIEEMELLERQLTSSKLLDRIDEIPVNYLLDANSEMEILRRDMSNMREKYDVDPNLLRVAAYFSVLTRLLPPRRTVFPPDWDDEKKQFYLSISPEQKLFIYTCQAEDPLGTIRRLPHWHPFRGEMLKLKINIHDTEEFSKIVERDVNRISLEQSGAFTAEQLQLVDDEFMRLLWNEHYPEEGKNGVSVRQLQNIMRDTIAHSDGYRIHVGTFFGQLKRMFAGSPGLRHWLTMDPKHREGRAPGPMRFIGDSRFAEGEGDYGDYKGLARVTQALYNDVVRHEITMATVNRDPAEIALDLRRYLQHALLARAHENRAFAHIMVPRFTFIDPTSGEKVDQPDENYLRSIENILDPDRGPSLLRQETAKRFLDLHERGELALEPGKPVIASRQDNVLTAFGQEYQRLLSHRRTMGEIDADRLVEAFFQKRRSRDVYEALPKDIREFAETVIWNLVKRFGYSKHSALDTVLFAIRKEIVQFREIIS